MKFYLIFAVNNFENSFLVKTEEEARKYCEDKNEEHDGFYYYMEVEVR